MPTPFEDLAHAVPLSTHFVIYEDDTTGLIETTGEEPPRLSRPGRIVPEERYRGRLAELEAEHAEHIAQLEAEDLARTRGDYEALIAAGVPAATASRLSGYAPLEPASEG
ncbi:hypothetical protein OG272_15580 [Streptomyces sp. NBC_00104]|uniref:hypothetical protein n=1 Tax=Streptomyces sp. NBC_00104 TaxID=2903621 RepID=UPI0032481227